MFFVYILRCVDGSLYTGITNDVAKRLAAHKKGVGARYTRSHPPDKIVYTKKLPTKSAALKLEIEIKRWPRAKKMRLIKSYF